MLIESIRFSIKKAIQYRANLISWFLADLSLYTATFLGYYLLTQKIAVFGNYSREEILFYITCFFLVNNLYAIFFAEAVSKFGQSVLTGYFDFDLLKPQPLTKYIVLKNLNFPAAFSTPLLIALNIYCLKLCGIKLTIPYIISIFSAAILMGLLFSIVYSFTLFGLRSEAISGVVLQLLTVAEKPDTVFPKIVRNLLIYAIPIFLFSAIPARIALGKSSIFEKVWCYLSPVLYYLILKILLHQGLKRYQSGAE
ncbi:ABC transporter permease [Thermoanaerobacter wiegelii]|uniref:ABC transporter permease n=1 Tax=Thermoanaerobacter wiegelii Rt8.B1 TaxID=697303 RepID=G2MUH6_9THEO|nr:ABC transporter permease [Thermoanaerobacter wiegelii]AEM80003.1 protein of unknown function DUF990 [Thermoanaerobacter wiegelii Rt8.B1]